MDSGGILFAFFDSLFTNPLTTGLDGLVKRECEGERAKLELAVGQLLNLKIVHRQIVRPTLPISSPKPFPEPRPNRSFNQDVLQWMGQRGLSYLLQFQRAGTPIPSEHELAEYLTDIATDEGLWYLYLSMKAENEGKSTFDMFTLAWLDRSAPQCAAWVIKHYRSDYLSRASYGGQHHRPRQPKVFGAMLRPYAHLPAKEVADKLGISLATVYRVRARSAEWDARPKQEMVPLDLLSDLD